MSALLRRIFQIRPGEGPAIALLWAFSFANGVFVAFFYSVSSGQFLAEFEPGVLPLAYIASGLGGLALIAVFTRFESRFAVDRLVTGMLVLLAVVVVFFASALSLGAGRWVRFLMFASLLPVLTLLDLGFWALAGRLFDLQQGKRLFGLLRSGEVVSEILGFSIVPFLVGAVSPSGLLVAAAGGLLLGVVAARLIRRSFGAALAAQRSEEPGEAAPSTLRLFADRYIQLLALGALLAVVTLYFVDFAFLREVQARYGGESGGAEELTRFVAIFFAVTELAELVVKSVVAGRIITTYGLLTGLLILPASVGLFAVLALAIGSPGSPFFFLCVIFMKFFEYISRRAVHEPSVKALFQPLEAAVRLPAQSRAEGTATQVGVLLGGGSLLILGQLDTVVPLLWVLVVILVARFVLSSTTYRRFKRALVEALARQPEEAMLPSAVEIIRQRLAGATYDEVRYSLNVLELVDPYLLEVCLGDLLESERQDVRAEAYLRVARLRLVGSRERVERAASLESDPRIQPVAQAAVQSVREIEASALELERLKRLAAGETADERLHAAAMAGTLPGEAAQKVLYNLLSDVDTSVRRRALLSAGVRGDPDLWPQIIDQLPSSQFSKAAGSALITVGAPIVPALDAACGRFRNRPQVLARIIRVLERIGSAEVVSLLFERVEDFNREVEIQAIRSLGVLGVRATGGDRRRLISRKLEEAVQRLTWYTAARADLGAAEAVREPVEALEREMTAELERIFLLLALVCDAATVRLLERHIRSEDTEDRAYAYEVAGQALPIEMRPFLLPILEEQPPAQLLAQLEPHFPQRRFDSRARLEDIIAQGEDRVHVWIRLAAIDAWRRLEPDAVPYELAANLFCETFSVVELAAAAALEADPEVGRRLLSRLPARDREPFGHLIRGADGTEGGGATRQMLAVERLRALRATPILGHVRHRYLNEVAAHARERRFEADTVLFERGDPGRTFWVVLGGRIGITIEGRTLNEVKAGDLLGEIAAVETGVRTATATVLEPTHALELDREVLQDLMAEQIEVVPGIVETISRRRARG